MVLLAPILFVLFAEDDRVLRKPLFVGAFVVVWALLLVPAFLRNFKMWRKQQNAFDQLRGKEIVITTEGLYFSPLLRRRAHLISFPEIDLPLRDHYLFLEWKDVRSWEIINDGLGKDYIFDRGRNRYLITTVRGRLSLRRQPLEGQERQFLNALPAQIKSAII